MQRVQQTALIVGVCEPAQSNFPIYSPRLTVLNTTKSSVGLCAVATLLCPGNRPLNFITQLEEWNISVSSPSDAGTRDISSDCPQWVSCSECFILTCSNALWCTGSSCRSYRALKLSACGWANSAAGPFQCESRSACETQHAWARIYNFCSRLTTWYRRKMYF